MRVALIGGTGFVGSYVVDALIARGHEPSLLVRRGSERKLQRPEDCRVVLGEPASQSAIDEVLDHCDAVIFLIGILREFPRRGITFEQLQHEAPLRILERAKKRGVSRFLLMSANGARIGGTTYQDTKARAELSVLSSGLDATVFRPSVIFGDPRGNSEIATQLYRQMIRPPLPAIGFQTGWLPGSGDVRISPVHVADVAEAFAVALDNPATYGKTICLGGPDVLTWTEMLRAIARAAQRRKWIVPMPIGLMRVAAMLLDWVPAFPATRDQLRMLAEGNTADPAELEQLIQHAPKAFSSENLAYLLKEPM